VFDNLSSMSDLETSAREYDKWSKKEILGHLIDSASNNHQRFVRAQFTDDLVFPGYDQVEWVRVQDYQNINWQSLVELWKDFNFLIIHILSRISEQDLKKTRVNHNLDQIAWKEIPVNQPATLEYFVKDYYGHLRHHLNQILA
jgi:hypothetical protein